MEMDIKNEIWKDCKGYEGLYQISSLGRVWSIRKQRILKAHTLPTDYQIIGLTAKNGKQKKEYIHRLVALAFISNPEGKPQVNHKDENRLNNQVYNLEWVSAKENVNYGNHNAKLSASLSMEKHPKARKIRCIETDKIYNCIKQASIELHIDNSSITKACKGIYKSAGGYHWEYLKGDEK